MPFNNVLILHPGEMGAALGARLVASGLRAGWISDKRSEPTRLRAEAAGLHDLGTLADGLAWSDLVISVCPPHGALELASAVAAHGFSGHYVDANAVSPATSTSVEQVIRQGGAGFTDAGIIGPPPHGNAQCRLYLAGDAATDLQSLLHHPPLNVRVLDGPAGAASALKMCFSGWNKARISLLMNIRALAHVHGVESALLNEWSSVEPALMRFVDDKQPAGSVMASAYKAWRWAPEMTEIAQTMRDAGLPGTSHDGAAEVFDRLSGFKNRDGIPAFDELVEALLRQR